MLSGMQCIIHPHAPGVEQRLSTAWEGSEVEPPFFFSFYLEGDSLVFRARREAEASVHPQARPGCFCEELWRYDVVEFFIAAPDASHYLEFNLCPNGAWWAAGFTDPRVALPGFEGQMLTPSVRGALEPERWECEARLPLQQLEKWNWRPSAPSRMAVCAVICRGGQYTYLTTCEQRSGRPDFHHPWDWESPQA